MAIKDILATYKLVYSGPDVIARVEVVDAEKGAHVSDPARGIVPWHGYVGRPLPEDALAQVTNVRASLLALDPGLQDAKLVQNPRFIRKHCKGRSVYFNEDRNKGFHGKLKPEIAAEVDSVKARLAAESDPVRKAGLRKELMQTFAFKQLMAGAREGVPGAINTYDPVVVTWGMGWAIAGYLGKVLAAVYDVEKEKEPTDADKHHVQKLLYLAGFLYDRGTYYVVDTDQHQKTVRSMTSADISATLRWDESHGELPDNPALRLIHDVHELHVAWALLGRDDLTRPTLVKSQLRVFKAGTGDVPQAEKIQTAALYTFIAHLQHWTGRKLDVPAWATGPKAKPSPVSEPLPSEKGDAQLAVQAVHLLYSGRARYAFFQVRDYWKQMTTDDAREEGLTDFNPVYPIMTAPPVTTVPEDHLKVVDSKGTWDLGPLTDFGQNMNVPSTSDSDDDAERRLQQTNESSPEILKSLRI